MKLGAYDVPYQRQLSHERIMAQSIINVQRQAPGQDSGADVTVHERDMSAVLCSTIAIASVRGVLT